MCRENLLLLTEHFSYDEDEYGSAKATAQKQIQQGIACCGQKDCCNHTNCSCLPTLADGRVFCSRAADVVLLRGNELAQRLPESGCSGGTGVKLVARLYQTRKQYRLVCERPTKGNTAIDREAVGAPCRRVT